MLAPPAVDAHDGNHHRQKQRSKFEECLIQFDLCRAKHCVDLAKLLGHFGTKFYELCVHVGTEIDDLVVDSFESGVHVGAEVHKLAVDDFKLFIYEFELADDFAKVGVDLDSHVVEILLCCWLVHGVIVVVNQDSVFLGECEIVGGMGRSVTQAVLWVSSTHKPKGC